MLVVLFTTAAWATIEGCEGYSCQYCKPYGVPDRELMKALYKCYCCDAPGDAGCTTDMCAKCCCRCGGGSHVNSDRAAEYGCSAEHPDTLGCPSGTPDPPEVPPSTPPSDDDVPPTPPGDDVPPGEEYPPGEEVPPEDSPNNDWLWFLLAGLLLLCCCIVVIVAKKKKKSALDEEEERGGMTQSYKPPRNPVTSRRHQRH